ncbi:MAG: hypothetical protein ACOX6H_03105 [Christensenellales bacterium]
METPDLKIIKKKYSENFAKLCRTLFPTILEEEGVLYEIILSNFAPTRFLYDDLIETAKTSEFKNLIYHIYNLSKEVSKVSNDVSTPYELMKKAGYTLYKCNTQDDINSCMKYWHPDELLCTFADDERINTHIVFFAVKDGAKELKRKSFKNPERQDEYGTSVISIQFSNDSSNTLSIKNRYNHTVKNPDATFSNNLDNIIPGLTQSFVREFNLNIESNQEEFLISNYIRAADGKLYRHHFALNGYFFCENNILIQRDNSIISYDSEKCVLTDGFVIHLDNKKIERIETSRNQEPDSFVDYFNDNIKKIEIIKENGCKTLLLTPLNGELVKITLDKFNRIIKYSNPNITEVKDNFMYHNRFLEELDLPNLKSTGNNFLYHNTNLKTLNTPQIKTIENYFLSYNTDLKTLNLPLLETVGIDFITYNKIIEKLSLPNLTSCGISFMSSNKTLKTLSLPNLRAADKFFMSNGTSLIEVYLPNLTTVEACFIMSNSTINKIYLPKLKKVGNMFLNKNTNLTTIDLPNLVEVGSLFLNNNSQIQKINLPKLKIISSSFMTSCTLQEKYKIEAKLYNNSEFLS